MRLTAQPGHLRCARTRPPLCEACELGERGNHRVGHRPPGWSPPTLRGPSSGQIGRPAAASSCAGVRRAEDRGWQRSHRVGVRALRRDDGRPGFPGPGGRAAEPWSPVVPDPGWLWSRGGCCVVGRGRRDDRAGPCRQPGRARPCPVWVTTGAAGLAAAAERPFDLALLHLGLPDMDGVEVCRRLRVVLPGCVLVVLTARDEEIDVVVGLEAGADGLFDQAFPARGVVGSGQRSSAAWANRRGGSAVLVRGPGRGVARRYRRPAGSARRCRARAAGEGVRSVGPVRGPSRARRSPGRC